MIGLLVPLGLLGLLALAVPIVAHLVSRRAGRVVKVGSIRWMHESPAYQSRSLKLHDLWLLLLRLAVVALLALALAGPYWRHRPAVAGTNEWVLIGPDVARDSQYRPLIDSLARVGEVHLLSPGLPHWIPGDALPASTDLPALSALPALTDYWSLLREAEQLAPPATRFSVVTSDNARYFRGERPRLKARVEWRLVSGSAAQSASIADSVKTVELYAPATRRDDARYLVAALQAAAQEAGVRVRLLRRPPSSASAPAEDASPSIWIIWLGGDPVPDGLKARVEAGATLLVDPADDSVETLESLLITGPSLPAQAHLFRRSTRTLEKNEAALWTDEYGVPVLSVTRTGAGLVYRLRIRLHPDWTDLVMTPALPRLIGSLWLGPSEGDLRVAPSQVVPALVAKDASPIESRPARPDLAFSVWLLTLLAFGLERAVSLDWFRSRA
ncbi:MAG TPA: BatA domain-containing protein [Gemmatimonadales bacterium]|nr:BatA domain-containing protein [Gemmatimonadales bacterium]